eukprot:6002986-Pyramimonas_sp.AAC.1
MCIRDRFINACHCTDARTDLLCQLGKAPAAARTFQLEAHGATAFTSTPERRRLIVDSIAREKGSAALAKGRAPEGMLDMRAAARRARAPWLSASRSISFPAPVSLEEWQGAPDGETRRER